MIEQWAESDVRIMADGEARACWTGFFRIPGHATRSCHHRHYSKDTAFRCVRALANRVNRETR